MASLTQRITTTVGAHGMVDRLALYGRSLGLSVTHERAGGWFEKDHLLRVAGEADAVRRFASAVRKVQCAR